MVLTSDDELITFRKQQPPLSILMIRTEMGRSNVAAGSIMQRREALDEVAAIALIFSDGIFVA